MDTDLIPEESDVGADEDLLDEIIRESTARNPEFAELMERARRTRQSLGPGQRRDCRDSSER